MLNPLTNNLGVLGHRPIGQPFGGSLGQEPDVWIETPDALPALPVFAEGPFSFYFVGNSQGAYQHPGYATVDLRDDVATIHRFVFLSNSGGGGNADAFATYGMPGFSPLASAQVGPQGGGETFSYLVFDGTNTKVRGGQVSTKTYYGNEASTASSFTWPFQTDYTWTITDGGVSPFISGEGLGVYAKFGFWQGYQLTDADVQILLADW
jgi:hypothetical protein